MSECIHENREYVGHRDDVFICLDCRAYIPIDRNGSCDKTSYECGWQAGYAAAKAEMVRKLDEFKPTYVDGGRVPEDAIEHRNQPRRTDGPSV